MPKSKSQTVAPASTVNPVAVKHPSLISEAVSRAGRLGFLAVSTIALKLPAAAGMEPSPSPQAQAVQSRFNCSAYGSEGASCTLFWLSMAAVALVATALACIVCGVQARKQALILRQNRQGHLEEARPVPSLVELRPVATPIPEEPTYDNAEHVYEPTEIDGITKTFEQHCAENSAVCNAIGGAVRNATGCVGEVLEFMASPDSEVCMDPHAHHHKHKKNAPFVDPNLFSKAVIALNLSQTPQVHTVEAVAPKVVVAAKPVFRAPSVITVQAEVYASYETPTPELIASVPPTPEPELERAMTFPIYDEVDASQFMDLPEIEKLDPPPVPRARSNDIKEQVRYTL